MMSSPSIVQTLIKAYLEFFIFWEKNQQFIYFLDAKTWNCSSEGDLIDSQSSSVRCLWLCRRTWAEFCLKVETFWSCLLYQYPPVRRHVSSDLPLFQSLCPHHSRWFPTLPGQVIRLQFLYISSVEVGCLAKIQKKMPEETQKRLFIEIFETFLSEESENHLPLTNQALWGELRAEIQFKPTTPLNSSSSYSSLGGRIFSPLTPTPPG